MNTSKKGTDLFSRQGQEEDRKNMDYRIIKIGTLSILTLAFLALVVRNFVPDLNPLILIGLGVSIYGIFLGTLALTHMARMEEEARTKKAKVEARVNSAIEDRR